jgi:serine/threonine protein kinase
MSIFSRYLSSQQAVKHLHDHNLIHLDIKLENILVALNGRYKLGDFGLVVDVSKVCPFLVVND